ncbi:MAG: undecaprenyldiphospho-muramoylpentapeptide beta-N-acetylglucosaminyltransferase [Calditrichaeota bacterium]|nr:undecaprenyldiphospho-muramoylpentapeptide beta-N-acetylglucosaminyltransferase [Calditrichota bacterium]
MKTRVLITGGGTGGHVYPAIATMEALQEQGAFEFLYVGGKGGIETRIIPERGIPLRTIWIAGFQRYWTWKNFLFPIKLLVSLMQSWWILKQFRPQLAIGTGGYVTGPVLFMAARMGIPVLIEEQDVHPGVTTRLLARHARKICVAFEGTREALKDVAEKVVVTGNPVRRDLTRVSRQAAREQWGFREQSLVVFIFGGSQGAQSINRAMAQLLPTLLQEFDMEVLWQTGARNYATVQQLRQWPEDRVRVVPYVKEMAAAYAAADLIVARAGAITLAELALVQKPAILVPYPHAAGNHQEHNARFIASRCAAVVVTEREGWEAELLHQLKALLGDAERRQQMARSWKALARPDAARKIAHIAIELLKTQQPNPTMTEVR